MKEIKTFSAKETVEAGIRLGAIIRKGDIICLNGGMGTGKTAFTGGIAAALGIKGYITSPTFTIVNEYKGRIPLYHFDVYRIADPEEMFEIGFEEYLDGQGVVVIEWAEQIRDILPADYIKVDIKKNMPEGQDIRIIDISFMGSRYSGYEEMMKIADERVI